MFKGRGAQIQVKNKFLAHEYVQEHIEGIDEFDEAAPGTKYIKIFPKTIVNKVESPDVGMDYSLNPYQGCEHGCIYCYARNSHEYWGYNAGLDFERVILYKPNAAQLLEKHFQNPRWNPRTIVLSGNTDCYQPIERKLKITRSLLEVFLKYKHPVGLITKNVIITRDIDLLGPLADLNLVGLHFSLTSLDEKVRRKLEPRTATAKQKLKTIEKLSQRGIPVSIMIGPVIPGLNDHEIPALIKAAANAGARGAGFTMVRLNGQIGEVFENWVQQAFPDRAEKILSQIKGAHGGKLNDSRFGKRMRGDGRIVQSIHRMFELSKAKCFTGIPHRPPLRTDLFVKTNKGQMGLF
ncbi:PA0069 family radical SAM protein [Roseivirga misakiensis]|uniref:Radical SAM protein n=1 Tax=Roseivirga misakiensis TaxID=1563681 RepID=A0A1E5T6C5_9BACT|nr:PA0069 family radical SAM protein [Roseivirga misakiensis]OEK06910.1 radical SAM protein [Roseivirga misakiensis]